jgi:hypothetical protein
VGYGHCSYASVTTTKQTVCSAECVSKILKDPKKNPDGTFANVCDKDNGWACDYTVTAVQCCLDTDCINTKLYCDGTRGTPDYGKKYVECDLSLHTCTKCGGCVDPSQCDNQCCEYNLPGHPGEKCVPINTLKNNNQYLCASASPTGWHECNAVNLAKSVNNAGKSYVCLTNNGQYEWNDVSWLKNVMIAIAFAFVLMFLVRKRF